VNLEKETEALRALDKVLKLNPRDNEAQSQRALIVRKMAQVSDVGERIHIQHSLNCEYKVGQTGCNRELGWCGNEKPL